MAVGGVTGGVIGVEVPGCGVGVTTGDVTGGAGVGDDDVSEIGSIAKVSQIPTDWVGSSAFGVISELSSYGELAPKLSTQYCLACTGSLRSIPAKA